MNGSGAEGSILVTGGAGFIGQNFVHHLVNETPLARIVVLDALTYAANPNSLQHFMQEKKIRFEYGNICDVGRLEELFREFRFTAVINFAAESHVDRSIKGPDAFIETNIIGTYNLLKCALAQWEQSGNLPYARFVHVSTDEVFGDLGPDEPSFTEVSPYKPSSPYSASKAASDHLVRAFGRTYALPTIITNCSNNYGPYQHPEKLIPLMIIRALEGKSMPVYGDGLNIRDWLHVNDHCRMLRQIMWRGRIGETYNLGGDAERANLDVVHLICDFIDELVMQNSCYKELYPHSAAANRGRSRDLIAFIRDRPGHDRRYAINSHKVRIELGLAPSRSFEDGLRDTVRWYLDNESWWRAVLAGGLSQWIATHYKD